MKAVLVVLFLAAIVAANLITTTFGPEASIYNAFFLIGLDLVTRDKLHDLWGKNRLPYMAGLIAAGSLLSYLINQNAGPIALASAAAFGSATLVDYVVYSAAHDRPWLERVNISNVPAAAVDSVVFVALAFGVAGAWPIIFAQFAAKVGGGALWAIVIGHVRTRRTAAA